MVDTRLPESVTAGSTGETTITIMDNDVPEVFVSFENSYYGVAEGGQVTVKALMSADPERNVNVVLRTRDRDGATGDDYTGIPVRIRFAPGQTEQTFTITAAQNDDDETDVVEISMVIRGVHRVRYGLKDVAVLFINESNAEATPPPAPTALRASTPSQTQINLEWDAPEYDGGSPITGYRIDVSTDHGRTWNPLVEDTGNTDTTYEHTGLAAGSIRRYQVAAINAAGTGPLSRYVNSGTRRNVISNFVFADDTDEVQVLTDGTVVAQGFGAGDQGATGSALLLRFARWDTGVEVKVSIWTTANQTSNVPKDLVMTFTGPDSPGTGEQTFLPDRVWDVVRGHTARDQGGTLRVLGNYLIVIESAATGTAEAHLEMIDRTGHESAGSNWGISDWRVSDFATSPPTTDTEILRIRIQGSDKASEPDAPMNLEATANGQDRIDLSWDEPDDNADQITGYRVEKSNNGFGWDTLTHHTRSTETTYIHTGLNPNTQRHYRVRAINGQGTGGNSNVATATTRGPSGPTGLVATAVGPRQIDLSWNAPTDWDLTVDGYNIEVSTNDGKTYTDLVADTGSTDTTYSDTGLSPGKTRYYRLYSLSGSDEGNDESNYDSATTDALEVNFEQSSYTVSESDDTSTIDVTENSATVRLTLNTYPDNDLTIPITAVVQGGATSADYSGVPNSVRFDASDQETEKEFIFIATMDSEDDDGESVKLTFGTLLEEVTAGAANETTITITDDDMAVSFEQASYTVGEGDSVTVEVTLSMAPENAVTIPITKANQDGASDSDYSGVPDNVVFNAGQTEKSFSFTAIDDSEDDDDESVKLGFGTLPDHIAMGTNTETTIHITDDDHPGVTVRFENTSYSTAEGKPVEVKIILSADPERSVTIPVNTTNQGGATDGDYLVLYPDMTFDAGETEKIYTFVAAEDTEDDDGESVKLTFGTLPTGVSEGTNDEAVVSINDDDNPDVAVSYKQASYMVAESDDTSTTDAREDRVTITVTLSPAPERPVTIFITHMGQNGVGNADYTGVPARLDFGANDTEKAFNFTAIHDTADDDGESVLLGFRDLPAMVSAGTNSTATVSITDDDNPQVSVRFAQATYTVTESDATSTMDIEENKALVRVILSADPERTVTIPITSTNQDGASNGDYGGVPASVVFNSGDTEKTFTFTAVNDSVDDDGESVKLGFGTRPAMVSLGATDETVVSIQDDDKPTSLTVDFGAAAYTVTEGGNVTVKITLNDDPEMDVTIPITPVHENGASNQDYSGVPDSVTFNSGDTEKEFTFTAVNDTEDDDNESVKLTFGTLPTVATAGSTDEAVVSITDDDDPTVSVSFQQAAYTVAEGSNVGIKVQLNADPERTVTIPVSTANQGGAQDSDYSGVPNNVVFNPGQTEKTITFTAVNDTVDDDGESVSLTFGNLPPLVNEGATNEAVVSITDDDRPTSLTVNFEQSTYTVAEGSNVAVKVTLNDDPEQNVTIRLTTTNQDRASNSDYSGVPSSLTFTSGDTEKTFTFRATGNTLDDDDESVLIAFGTLPTTPVSITAGSTDETVVNITDDDVPQVTVSYQNSAYTVREGSSVTVRVQLSADPERTVTIPIIAADQGGASDQDYSGVPDNLTFNSGDTSMTFSFTAAQDTLDDDDESVLFTFGAMPTRVSEGTTNESVVSITDDDHPQVSVSYENATYTAPEGGSVAVKVVMSADPERTVMVSITKTNLDGASDSDYTGVSGTVTFNPGDTEKTITFAATQDTVVDDGEKVRLGFGSSLPARAAPAQPASPRSRSPTTTHRSASASAQPATAWPRATIHRPQKSVRTRSP